MIDRIASFVNKHLYETFLALFMLIFGGSIFALWSTVLSAFTEYPSALFLMCALSFFAGLMASAMRDRRAAVLKQIEEDTQLKRDRMRAEEQQRINDKETAERKEKELEEERLRMEEVHRAFEKRIMEMDFDMKAVLFMVYERKRVAIPWVEYDDAFSSSIDLAVIDVNDMLGRLFGYGFLKYETIESDMRTWYVQEKFSGLIDEHQELFSRASKLSIEIYQEISSQ